MASRRFASLLSLGLLFAAVDARAQSSIVTPTPGPSVPGYAPPGGYAPYGGYAPPYAPYAPPPGYYYYMPAPVTPMRRNNPAMATGGIVMVSVGGVALIAGVTMFSAGGRTTLEFPPCPSDVNCQPMEVPRHPELKYGGIGMIVGSIALMGAGIPLIAIGSKKVPDKPEATQSLLPDVRVGAGSLSARWSF